MASSDLLDISNSNRIPLHTEYDADSPHSEESYMQLKHNIEGLTYLLFRLGKEGSTGSVVKTPTTSKLECDNSSDWTDDLHDGRTLVLKSGAARGLMYTIDVTSACGANSSAILTATGDNFADDGVASGDDWEIYYKLKDSTGIGHTHDDVNSPKVAAVASSGVVQASIKTGTGTADASLNAHTKAIVSMQDYCFFPKLGGVAASSSLIISPYNTTATSYVGMLSVLNQSEGSLDYFIGWRYITASDEPFFYAVRDKSNQKIMHMWRCDDPPSGYWGLDKEPEGFQPPLQIEGIDPKDSTEYEAITIFKWSKKNRAEVEGYAKQKNMGLRDVLSNDFDYNPASKTFIKKKGK